jgi:putative MATE family efflux protein
MESNHKNTVHLMTEGNILRELIVFAIPLVLGNLLQQLYSTFDSIIVGNCVGTDALAAVGSSGNLIFLIVSFAQGASVGAGVIVSQYLGAQDHKGVHRSVHTSLAIALLLGVIMSIGGVLASKPLLLAMNTPASVLPQSNTYLKIYFAGTIFTVLYNMATGILNAVGNSSRALRYLAIASVTNIVLDILLVAYMNMGIAGAAIATVFSQFLSCVFSMAFLMRTEGSYRVSLHKIRFHRADTTKIIKVGFPTGIQNTVISISNLLIQTSVNGYGAIPMAGFASYLKIDGFNILPVLSISMAITTFTGQNVGARRYDRVKKGTFYTLLIVLVYTIATGILLLTFSRQIMRLFTSDPDVIAYGRLIMWYFCPFYWLLGILHGLAGTVRGTGKSVPPMAVLLISLCLYRVLWIWFILPHFSSIRGVFIAYPTSWLLGAILMIIYTVKAKWLYPVSPEDE